MVRRLVTVVFTLCVFILSFCGCFRFQMKPYYNDKSNYVAYTGVVEYIKSYPDEEMLVIAFSDITPTISDNCFKISGDNYNTVISNKALEKLHIGDSISFVSAPKYYGDGYMYPIVGLSIGDDVLLDTAEGIDAFIEVIR